MSNFTRFLYIVSNILFRVVDADLKPIQQINNIGNLDRAAGSTMFFIIEEAKETILDISKGTVKILWFYFVLI